MAEMAKSASDVDLAYQILHRAGCTIYFRDLITQVLQAKGISSKPPAQLLSEVHTQINMDSRFVHAGKGMWGLAEWLPQRGARHVDESAATISDLAFRREKLLEEIQEQDCVAAAVEADEVE